MLEEGTSVHQGVGNTLCSLFFIPAKTGAVCMQCFAYFVCAGCWLEVSGKRTRCFSAQGMLFLGRRLCAVVLIGI